MAMFLCGWVAGNQIIEMEYLFFRKAMNLLESEALTSFFK